MDSEKYIGLDVHQATISVAVMDSTGKLVMESILETKAATILQFVGGLRGIQRQKRSMARQDRMAQHCRLAAFGGDRGRIRAQRLEALH